jgi:hypothetical protein
MVAGSCEHSMNLHTPYNAGNFLTTWGHISFLNMTVLHGIGLLRKYSFILLIANTWFHDLFLVTDNITCLYLQHVILSTIISGKTHTHQHAYMLLNQTVQWAVISHCLIKHMSNIKWLWKGETVQITQTGEWHILEKVQRGACRQQQSKSTALMNENTETPKTGTTDTMKIIISLLFKLIHLKSLC